MTDLLFVVGGRAGFTKAASVVGATRQAGLTCALVNTGRHFDADLSRVFFDELELPAPDVSLGVGSGSHAAHTASVMLAFEAELLRIRPSLVVVVGDADSALACALVAAKEGVPVAHVEAGLRCFDPTVPEEINRRLCDRLSTRLFTTSRDAGENLAGEGISMDHVFLVGNTMVDTLLRVRAAARERGAPARYGLDGGDYCLVALDRPNTFDEPDAAKRVLEAVVVISRCVPVVFAIHPRACDQLSSFGLADVIEREPGLILSGPLGYLDLVGLMSDARLVLTDSGSSQEETTALGVQCLTLLESTDRPVTVAQGTNRLVGTDQEQIVEEALTVLEETPHEGRTPELWDGAAGERVAAILCAEVYAEAPARTAATR